MNIPIPQPALQTSSSNGLFPALHRVWTPLLLCLVLLFEGSSHGVLAVKNEEADSRHADLAQITDQVALTKIAMSLFLKIVSTQLTDV